MTTAFRGSKARQTACGSMRGLLLRIGTRTSAPSPTVVALRFMQTVACRPALPTPPAIASSSARRSTTSNGSTQGLTPLERQRLHRPVAPHLGIYKWQITSVLSISTRITGLMLSGMFYAFGAAYLAAPYLGWDLSVDAMVEVVKELPWWLKGVGKVGLAFPFVFHCLNGTRFFFFDMAMGMKNTQVKRSGWVVVGLTTVLSLVLATLV